jgi:biotin synthase
MMSRRVARRRRLDGSPAPTRCPRLLEYRMDLSFYDQLAADALADRPLAPEAGVRLLTDPEVDLFPLLHAAYRVRRRHHGKVVQVHILNNAQNGKCPEDCAYCAQARTSDAEIEEYPIKDEAEILAEADRAHRAGAHRYCMVFAGRGPNERRTQVLAGVVRKIKASYPAMEVCVSAGLVDDAKAAVLKEAGLDRLNHNLNTSRANYATICTTHTYDDRLNTLRAAKRQGLEVCSGLIAGMGETPAELVEIATTLREVESQSIPVNFLLPIEGNRLTQPRVGGAGGATAGASGVTAGATSGVMGLTPEYCLRVLCLFRFANPRAEVRCGAGREYHLRSMEVLSMYPANSLFLDGYLNGRGSDRQRTYQMLVDAGFEIESEYPLADLLGQIDADTPGHAGNSAELTVGGRAALKSLAELRPVMSR